MFNGNSLIDFTSFFLPNDFKKNDDIILNYFLTNILKGLSAILLSAILLKDLIYIQI